MRIPRPRLRVGTLLIAVAAFALGIGADGAYNRYGFCMERAAHYRYSSKIFHDTLKSMLYEMRHTKDIQGSRRYQEEELEDFRRRIENYDELVAKFERAAWLPFLPLPEDPDAAQPSRNFP